MSDNKQLTPVEPDASVRFTKAVISRYGNAVGEVNLTDYEKQLVQRYFIKFDATLKTTERDRAAKNAWTKGEQNDLPAVWQNVDLDQLAEDVVFYARMGLDPMMKNFLNIIPFRAKKAEKYTATFIEGYEGKKYVAFEMALDRPIAIICDVVYKNDVFKPHFKKPLDPNSFDSYEYDAPQPFDRGELVGGFGYVQYADPRKNQLLFMSKKEIDKRKPRYASVEFWGGDKDVWKDGKKDGKEHIDGWYDEMAYKTMIRATCDLVTLDPKKVNANYAAIESRREEYSLQAASDQVTTEIAENANGPMLAIEAVEEQAAPEPEALPAPTPPADGQQASFISKQRS
jgi:recombination protein RecT